MYDKGTMNKSTDKSHILFNIDSAYIWPWAVCMQSLALNSPGHYVHVVVPSDSLELVRMCGQELSRILEMDIEVFPIDLDYTYSESSAPATWVTSIALARLQCHRFEHLRDLHKILYMDADTIVTKSLDELFQVDVRSEVGFAAFAKNYDMFIRYALKHVDVRVPRVGLNSGVLLINLDHWRLNDPLESEVVQKLLKHGLCDQAILMTYAQGMFTRLDEKWNIACPANLSTKLVKPDGVVHYVGQQKPWQRRRSARGTDSVWWRLNDELFKKCNPESKLLDVHRMFFTK
jgi:lipopolysaccharide biosynthesis glycosyltransferase